MTLTYMKRVQVPIQNQCVQTEVRIPDHWGMYTPAGNKSIKKKAEKLVKEIQEVTGISDKLAVFKKYFKGWRSLHRTKTMAESSDTEVRECVWCFAEQVAKAVDVDSSSLDKVWDEVY